ncbi:UNVERIFIED_CONTAM: hypothetical protein Slati_0875100 [Sesamum latifolium]|uniref:Endonuclease/exonuclease/phosphatase domain-containing protein n=1 Tax=Sesamum latifolium TaxID=2727402 RepID=A0AAW2XMH4_9LAMI
MAASSSRGPKQSSPLTWTMMNVATWNVRGLNRRDHQVAVADLVGEFRLHFIGLLETRVSPLNYARIQNIVLPRWSWFNDTAGPGNRIWIAWDSAYIDVDVLNVGEQFVHCRVFIGQLHEHILVTVAYGANDIITRRELWHALDSLSDQIDVPWLVCGDFNAVLDDSEICGTAGDTSSLWRSFGLSREHWTSNSTYARGVVHLAQLQL